MKKDNLTFKEKNELLLLLDSLGGKFGVECRKDGKEKVTYRISIYSSLDVARELGYDIPDDPVKPRGPKVKSTKDILLEFMAEQRKFNTEQRMFNTEQRVFNTEQRVFNTEQRVFNANQKKFNAEQRVFNADQKAFNKAISKHVNFDESHSD